VGDHKPLSAVIGSSNAAPAEVTLFHFAALPFRVTIRAPMSELQRQLGAGTATSVVVANMIGAGIFTTTGLMLAEAKSGTLVLLAWFLGGVIALCGALCYAELATMMPRAGGEYAYLREIYGPLPAFLTGWTSFFVGFSAPIAASAMGGAAYLRAALELEISRLAPPRVVEKAIAVILVLALSLLHSLGVRLGGRVQNVLTLLKVVLLVGMVAGGFVVRAGTGGESEPLSGPGVADFRGLGVALLWVMFAYSGWNAAAYLGEEVERPERTLPRSLLLGTLAVMLIYVAVNALFLTARDASQFAGRVTVFDVAVRQIFGEAAGRWSSFLVFFALLSSLSAYVLIGPRVYFAMARDGLFFQGAAAVHPQFATPARAIWAQASCACVMVLSGTFDQLLTYIGFALGIFPWMAVAGVMVLRRREPQRERPYRAWGYPVTPVFFLLAMAAILAVSFAGRPRESLIALATVAAGVPVYYLWFRSRA